MAPTYTREFRIRHYECDAYGHVNNTNYLRYMQEAALDASAAVGYDLARYADLERRWLVRETEIEYLQPLQYGDTVRLKTWVADFQWVTSRRMYEFYKGPNLCARAHTDWVFMNSVTNQPVKIPADMKTAFFPEESSKSTVQRDNFPPAPSPPPGVFTMPRRVMWQDVGPAGHVNNTTYLAYIGDCGMQVAAAFGWPAPRMSAEGFAIVVRRHRIEYRLPALLDDELEVATWVSDVKRATVFRHYTITRISDGALIARARTLYVWIHLETGQPLRIPARFLADFAPNIVK